MIKSKDLVIDPSLRRPKYLQIVRSVLSHIEKGRLKMGDQLPSINEISIEHFLSRETVLKAYKELKERGIITSKHGKGFYIKSIEYQKELNIFLLFNKLSAHKKVIYDAFINKIGPDAKVDLFIYNNDFEIFKNLILSNIGQYSHYVIISHFIQATIEITDVLSQIPEDRLVILDRDIENLEGEHPRVYQNFHKDIYDALDKASHLLQKYHRVNLIFPSNSYHPSDIKHGFQSFCEQRQINFRVLPHFEDGYFEKQEAFIILDDNNLVKLLKKVKKENLKIGKDVGIISYNENPLKEFIANGLTVVSTDFEKMGETAAEMILRNKLDKVENPFLFIERNSL
jgi:DNA-binding transcriptional regulator YhcF (GntR family)